jgi:hypothetical protein
MGIVVAIALLSAAPINAESLLVYEPVNNEVLGELVLEGDKAVFYDCQNKVHDPTGGEIRSTQEVCSPSGSIYASLSTGKIIQMPVFATDGRLYGRVEALSVGSGGKSFELIVRSTEADVTKFSVLAKVIGSWEESGGKLSLDDTGFLKWDPTATSP